jgi:hypothetical protein
VDPNPYQNVTDPQHYLSFTSVSQTNFPFHYQPPSRCVQAALWPAEDGLTASEQADCLIHQETNPSL